MKYSKLITDKICGYLRAGNTQKDAAILVGINQDTFYDWKKHRAEFSEAIEKAEAECQAAHIVNVRRAAFGDGVAKPTWQASAWWLERTNPERFGLKFQGAITGKDGRPLIPGPCKPAIDLSGFNVDQLKSLLTALEAAPPVVAHTNGTNGNGS